jgi:hypothetical protein
MMGDSKPRREVRSAVFNFSDRSAAAVASATADKKGGPAGASTSEARHSARRCGLLSAMSADGCFDKGE